MSQPYRLTNRDVMEASAAFRGQRLTRPVRDNRLIGWLLFISLVIALFALLRGGDAAHSDVQNTKPSALVPTARLSVAVSFCVLVFIWFFVLRRLRLKETGQNLPVIASLTDDGICFDRCGVRFEFLWAHFTEFIETPTLFVFRQQGQVMRIVPKASLTAQEQIDLRLQGLQHLSNVLPPMGAP